MVRFHAIPSSRRFIICRYQSANLLLPNTNDLIFKKKLAHAKQNSTNVLYRN
jgi:hypothetical protein